MEPLEESATKSGKMDDTIAQWLTVKSAQQVVEAVHIDYLLWRWALLLYIASVYKDLWNKKSNLRQKNLLLQLSRL